MLIAGWVEFSQTVDKCIFREQTLLQRSYFTFWGGRNTSSSKSTKSQYYGQRFVKFQQTQS